MDSNYSLSDIAAVAGENGLGGSNAWIMIILFALIFGNGGFGFGNRGGDFGQYATAASQTEILLGQQFQNLDNKMDRLGNGIADATFALNNSVKDGNYATQTAIKDCCCTTQRNTDALRYDMAQGFANANATTTAAAQKILDALAQNKIDSLQAQVSELKTQTMFCGIPRINPYGYGVYAYNNAPVGCGCQSL